MRGGEKMGKRKKEKRVAGHERMEKKTLRREESTVAKV